MELCHLICCVEQLFTQKCSHVMKEQGKRHLPDAKGTVSKQFFFF